MQENPDYRNLLKEELGKRQKRNPTYSLRSFARDLKMSAASLSKILGNKQGVSSPKAIEISKLLKLGPSETELFCTSVESNHARAKVNRIGALEKLNSEPLREIDLSLDYFRIISDWHHYAILELSEAKGFQRILNGSRKNWGFQLRW
jgi:uncharacterized protein (TIGR02147 family)